jgi:hypothetical protein
LTLPGLFLRVFCGPPFQVSFPSHCIAHRAELGFTRFVEFIEFFGLTRVTQQTQETEQTLVYALRFAELTSLNLFFP